MAIVSKLIFRGQWLRQGVCVVDDDGNDNASALSKLIYCSKVCVDVASVEFVLRREHA